MSRKATAGEALFATMGAVCAVIATLIFLFIGKSIARMGHDAHEAPAGHEAPAAEGAAPEAH
jgi:hypothetical protein